MISVINLGHASCALIPEPVKQQSAILTSLGIERLKKLLHAKLKRFNYCSYCVICIGLADLRR